MDLLILGCGYTGRRVAERFARRGAHVVATTREPERLSAPGIQAARLEEIPAKIERGCLVLHSIPPEGSRGVVELLGAKPGRVVYLSSTGVYGDAPFVDERTPVDVRGERARARVAAEEEAARGPWETLILRPAAIYGPGRGIHESILRGSYSLSDTYVSRIHVDDLAAHVEAALLSSLTGAYPVADEDPCTSRQMAEFCAGLLEVKLEGGHAEPSRFASNRRVDGSAVRRLLGITLKYPSYRQGVPAAIEEARRENRPR